MERATADQIIILFARLLGPLYPDEPDRRKSDLAERIREKAEEVAGLSVDGQALFFSRVRKFGIIVKEMREKDPGATDPKTASRFREMLRALLEREFVFGKDFSISRLISQSQLLWSDLRLRGGLSDKEMLAALAAGINPSRMVSESEMEMIFFSVLWADQGFPVIKASPRFVAASLVTQASQELLAATKAPWRAFAIDLPQSPDLLFMTDREGGVRSVAHVLVNRADNPSDPGSEFWSYLICSRDSADCIWRTHIPSTLLCDLGSSLPDDNPLCPLDSVDATALALVGRLIVSVVSAVSHREMVSEVDKDAHSRYAKRGKGRAFSHPAEPRVWQITAPIDIDLTERVRQFQLGEESPPDGHHRHGKPLTLQSVVAGHWKMQPCGPRHSQRKSMWIQPYWRGPENAPIAVRPHALDGVSNRVWPNPKEPS